MALRKHKQEEENVAEVNIPLQTKRCRRCNSFLRLGNYDDYCSPCDRIVSQQAKRVPVYFISREYTPPRVMMPIRIPDAKRKIA